MKVCVFITFILMSSLSIISCQKDYDPQSPTNTDSTKTPADTTSATTGAYQPLTVGSKWVYKDSASGTEATTTIGDSTKLINGILYKQYLSTGTVQVANGWIAASGPNYYFSTQVSSPGVSSAFQLTFYYLNDTASVGRSWDNAAATGSGFTANTKTTIVAKDLTMTVEGKVYKNVIQTHLDLSYTLFGTRNDYGTYDYFIAKGIGFIKIRTSVIAGVNVPTIQSCSNLTNYAIK